MRGLRAQVRPHRRARGAGARLRPVAEASNRRRAAKGRRHAESGRRPRRGCRTASRTSPASGTPRIPTAACRAPGAFVECGVEIGGSPLGGNLGRNLPGGLPYQPWAAELAKERRADDSRDDPHVRCLPDNPPRPWTLPHLTKAMHTPKLLALLYEVNAMYRQIYIDGRPLPEDPTPGWNGYSTAPLGRRHAGGPDRGLPRRPVDRHRRQPDERRGEDDRAHPPAELRHARASSSRSTIPRSTPGRSPST